MDPVKDAARKILNALLESSMDGYRLQSKTNLSEQALRQAVEELGELVTVQGNINSIGDAYFSILPSAQGLAAQKRAMLSMSS